MKFGRAIPTPIRILPTDSHGFIVDVGFATFACENEVSVLEVLREYIMDPTAFVSALNATKQGKELAKIRADNKLNPGHVMPPLPEGSTLKSPQF